MRVTGATLSMFIAASFGASGCRPPAIAHAPARPPSLADAGVPGCKLAASQLRPLIVEWSGADRGALELHLQRGLVAVRYEGCELEVLRECTVPGAYAYAGFTRKRDTVTIASSDDLFAQMPVGAYKLEGRLARGGTLHVDMTLVGMYEARRGDTYEDELQGRCDGATHLVTAAQVGAFSLAAGTSTGATAQGVERVVSHDVINSDGSLAACEAASTADRAAPEGCGALLRLEFTPLRAARHEIHAAPVLSPTPAPPEPSAAPVVDAPPVESTPAESTPAAPVSQWRAIDPTKIQHPRYATRTPITMEPRKKSHAYKGLMATGWVMFAGMMAGGAVMLAGALREGSVNATKMEPDFDPADHPGLDDRLRSAHTLQIAGAATASITAALGLTFFLLGIFRTDERQATRRHAPRWHVGPVLTRSQRGLGVSLRF